MLDETRRCPNLFAYLQRRVDEDPRPGRFVLTGSRPLWLMPGIGQSLAGRVTLLPFGVAELHAGGLLPQSLDWRLLDGGYLPVHERRLDPAVVITFRRVSVARVAWQRNPGCSCYGIPSLSVWCCAPYGLRN